MRWLVTVDADADLDAIGSRLHDLGCADVDTSSAVPLSDGEVSLPVEGPGRLPQLLADEPAIRGVFNDSDVTLYDDTATESDVSREG